jgi:hypothetical protein
MFHPLTLIALLTFTFLLMLKGGFMSLFTHWFGSKERRILILGLDGAGSNA